MAQAFVNALPSIPRVIVATITEISDCHGIPKTRADHAGVGSEDPNNWVAHMHGGGLVGTSPHTAGIAAWAENLRTMTGCKNVTFFLYPVDEDGWQDAARTSAQRRVRSTLGVGEDGKSQGIGENVGCLKPVKEENDCPYCVNTVGMNHSLEDCVCACSEGVLVGCILCNAINHSTDSCALFQNTTLAEKVNWLITKRAHKPPLKTEVPWYVVLHQFCMSPEFDQAALKGFPWTSEFASKRHTRKDGTYLSAIQKNYDANREYPLMVDPSTASFDSLWWTYWEELDLPWPRALGPRDDATDDVLGDADVPGSGDTAMFVEDI